MSVTNPGGYDLKTWQDCRLNLDHRIERRRIDSYKKGFVAGPYFTVEFPEKYTDEALNYVRRVMNGRLVSVTHRANEVYDWATSATFDIGYWPQIETSM